jgi:uncharacterized membrane protein
VRASWLFPAGAALGLVGLVLLVVETARALSGNTLGSLANVALWVGVALVVVGGGLLVLSVARGQADLDRGQPADG